VRGWRILVAALGIAWLVSTVAYGLVLGRSTQPDASVQMPSPGQVSVEVNPVSFTPDSGLLVLSIKLIANPDDLDSLGGLNNPVGITVEPAIENGFILLSKGSVPGTIQRTVQLNGSVRTYPFDRFRSPLVIAAAESVNAQWVPLQVRGAFIRGTVSGWDISPEADAGNSADLAAVQDADSGLVFEAGDKALVLDVVLARQGPAIGLTLILISLMSALAVLALLGVRAVALGRRKQEMTMTSWFAAMIFAMLPIRLALPGAPPMGAWIDVLVTFWVFILLMVSLIWWVLIWLRGRNPPA